MQQHPKFKARIDKDISGVGHSIIAVSGGNSPSFAYTVGLTETHGLPELIMIGVGVENACIILNNIVHQSVEEGLALEGDAVIYNAANLPLVLKKASSKHMAYTLQCQVWYSDAGHSCPEFMQVVLCDKNGKFPWDTNYDNEHMNPCQPALWALN